MRYSYGRPTVKWQSAEGQLFIGNFCSIACGVTIYLGGNHRTDWVTTYPFGHIHNDVFSHHGIGHPSTRGNVVIGNDVWIGDDVTIMSGVIIGDGAVIAKNSHVVKNVEPYSLVGGNPARHIKYRFKPEQIKRLLEIQWWNWPDEKIQKYIPLMCSDNIDEFLNQAK
jgi:acetyltransferase-like isoleucine patch superfamily enzyme